MFNRCPSTLLRGAQDGRFVQVVKKIASVQRFKNSIVQRKTSKSLLVKDSGGQVTAQSMQLIAGRTAQEYNQRKRFKGTFYSFAGLNYSSTHIDETLRRVTDNDWCLPPRRLIPVHRSALSIRFKNFHVIRTPSSWALFVASAIVATKLLVIPVLLCWLPNISDARSSRASILITGSTPSGAGAFGRLHHDNESETPNSQLSGRALYRCS